MSWNFDAVMGGAEELQFNTSDNLKLVLYLAPLEENKKLVRTMEKFLLPDKFFPGIKRKYLRRPACKISKL